MPVVPSYPLPSERRIGPVVGFALIAAYAATGKLALLLALPPGYAAAIFPPAGIAVAAALIAGRNSLAWVFAGSFLLNAWVAYAATSAIDAAGLAIAASIAAASTLQAFAGGWALRRFVAYPTGFDKGGDLIAFLLLSPVICLVSASLSVAALTAFGAFAAAEFWTDWATWWVGDTLGVIVVLPIVLAIAGEPRALWRTRALTVAGPMLATLAVIVYGYVRAAQWEFDASLRDFDTQSRGVARQFQAQFEEQEVLLQGIAAFMTHDPKEGVSRQEFQRYAARVLIHFPTVAAIEWAPRVVDAARSRFESAQSAQIPGFRIRERDSGGSLQRAVRRPTYFPLTYVEPADANLALSGFDLHSRPDRAAALDRAWDFGEPVATAPLQLLQDKEQLTGILLMLKAGEGGYADGVVLTVLRVRDFAQKALPPNRAGFDVCLADVVSQAVLFSSGKCAQSGPGFERILIYGTREYRLTMQPSAEYLQQHRSWASWMALAVALFGTGVLGAFLLLNAGTRQRREEEERLAYSLIGSDLAMTDWDIVRKRLVFGAGWTNLLGYEIDELRPRTETLVSLIHPEDAAQARAILVRHLKSETPMLEAEVRMRHKDGRWIWVLARGMAVARDVRGWALRITGTAKDITERKALQQQILADATEIADLYERAPCGYHSLSPDGTILRINATELEWLGRTREELVGKRKFLEFLTEEGRTLFREAFARFKVTGTASDIEYDLIHTSGRLRRVSLSATAIYDADGALRMSRSVLYDITEITRIRDNLRTLSREQSAMLDNDLVGMVRLRGRKAVWNNRAMDRIFGYAPGEITGTSSRMLYPDEETYRALGELAYPVLRSRSTYRTQLQMVRKGGELVWIDLSGVLLSPEDDESMWMMVDITALKRQQEQVEHLAFHDVLTDLPNRMLLADRLQQALASADRSGRKLAVVYLDLDGFKPVNDRYGHEVGDRLLQELASRFRACTRSHDTVCRMGGDEFVLVLTELTDDKEFDSIMARVLDEVSRPCRIDGGHDNTIEVSISASIGAALYPDDMADEESLLREADSAMYRAKALGRNRLVRATAYDG